MSSEAVTYAAYSPSATEAQVRAAFAAKYGCEPKIVKKLNVWLVGPKNEGGKHGLDKTSTNCARAEAPSRDQDYTTGAYFMGA